MVYEEQWEICIFNYRLHYNNREICTLPVFYKRIFRTTEIAITMSYIDRINTLLKPTNPTAGRVSDLFAGCGGLSLGFEA